MSAIASGLTDETAEVRTALRRAAGRYLHNVVRERNVTCRVCTAPVDGFACCWRCRQLQRIAGVADVVAPLTYAVGDEQSASLLHRYKDDPVRDVRERYALVINWLVFLGITLHEKCIAAAAGLPVSLRLVIPSLTGRPGLHPFAEIAQTMNAVGDSIALVPTGVCDRIVTAEKFSVQPDVRLDGQHVLVLDDAWTTGSNAQSAALALRRAGASAVSVMVVGRWLSSHFANTADFLTTRLGRDYDPDVCPVTGGGCP